jgi:two-component system, chemotaxis family, chemotaxis protein CheV
METNHSDNGAAGNLLDTIDQRTRLAGSNKLEILLFSLGTSEIFGINVFKVREVCKTPPITRTPNMPHGMEGVISLRGRIVPVVNLSAIVHIETASENPGSAMLVMEYSRRVLGFLVDDVDRIIRVEWSDVKPPEALLTGEHGMITAITHLEDGKLVSILDVEEILIKTFGEDAMHDLPPIESDEDLTVFFVDDSTVARKRIVEVLDRLRVKYKQATNGLEAWERLKSEAAYAEQQGVPLCEQIKVIMVDAEMPQMDGYVLTRNIKTDRRFDGIPVVMHSSLSSEANRTMGQSVGVDAYVAKFDSQILGETLRPLLLRQVAA